MPLNSVGQSVVRVEVLVVAEQVCEFVELVAVMLPLGSRLLGWPLG